MSLWKNLGACLIASWLPIALAQAQTGLTEQKVAFDSPEGWAMAYMNVATLNLGLTPANARAFGQGRIAAELSSIPSLTDEQQKVGFGGFKLEDLNQSPIFGRVRASIGIGWDITAEIAHTPSVAINGARANGVWGLALSKPLLTTQRWAIGLRAFGQSGTVTADVTCSASVANAPVFTTENPFGCVSPSKDRLTVDHHGGEITITHSPMAGKIQPWAGWAMTWMTPKVEINAPLKNTLQQGVLQSQGHSHTFSLGFSYSNNEPWGIHLASSFTPLNVKRSSSNIDGRDDFWNFKVGFSWDI